MKIKVKMKKIVQILEEMGESPNEIDDFMIGKWLFRLCEWTDKEEDLQLMDILFWFRFGHGRNGSIGTQEPLMLLLYMSEVVDTLQTLFFHFNSQFER